MRRRSRREKSPRALRREPSGANKRLVGFKRLALERLEARWLLVSNPLITELMADNTASLTDSTGAYSDWLEIYNPDSRDAINLAGWQIRYKNASVPWSFPAVTLGPGEHRIVFCTGSGTSRTNANDELHSDFKLDKAGAQIRLLKPAPDNTVVQNITYPALDKDISWGIGQTVTETTLLDAGAATRYFAPSDDSLGSAWKDPGFSTSGWSTGTTGVGFPNMVPGFSVSVYKSSAVSTIGNLATAQAVIDNPANQSWSESETTPSINYWNTGGRGHFIYDTAYPGVNQGQAVYNFAMKSTGRVHIPTAGTWTLGVNSDDAFRLTIPGVSFTSVTGGTLVNGAMQYEGLRTAADTLGVITFPATGDYDLNMLYFQATASAEVELFAAQGAFTAYTGTTAWRLIGDTVNSGLSVQSAPYTGSANSVVSQLQTNVATALQAAAQHTTLYTRTTFDAPDWQTLQSLTLKIAYDDGYVAWLNGVEVARRNAPPTVAWNSQATAARPSEVQSSALETVDLTSALSLLAGKTVSGIISAGGVATVTLANHGFAAGELIHIEGAAEAEYNGDFAISNVTADSFTYAITGNPASSASGVIVARRKENVLAIQVLNASPTDGDLLVLPELVQTVSTQSGTHYFSPATPGAVNAYETWEKAPDPKFSVEHGYYDTAFPLTLSNSAAGSQIYYTLDNSSPWSTNITTLVPNPSTKSISIVRSGTTATATSTGHGLANGQVIVISGAIQPEYNGSFVIANVTANTFDFTVSGAPNSPATGTLYAQPYPLVRSGSIATLTLNNHGYANGDVIQVTGAVQPEYNGVFSVFNVTTNTFSFTVNAAPDTPGAGSITILKVDKAVAGITRVGLTATATIANHGFATNDLVRILGANQPQYNGDYQVTVLDQNRFTYTLATAPATGLTGPVAANKLGQRYTTTPITISTTATVRARVYNSAYEPSDVVTQTYIFLNDVINQPANPTGFPLNWDNWAADYQMDPRVTQDPAYKDVMRDALTSIPTISIVSDKSNLFDANRGIYASAVSLAGGAYEAPEAPISLEYFDPNGNDSFQINAGVKIQGGAARGAQLKKHGMHIVFNSDYGPGKLEYPLFGDGATDKFDSLILRCSYGDQWTTGGASVQFIKDVYASSLQLALDQPARHGKFVNVYIDGLFWGMYDFGERPDADFDEAYMGGDANNWEWSNAGLNNDTNTTLPIWNTMLSDTKVGFTASSYQAGVPGFNATLYAAGASSTPGFTSIAYKANMTVASLADADTVISTPSKVTSTATLASSYVNFLNSGTEGHFTSNTAFPVSGDNFVVETTSSITIPTSGYWSFGVSSNDGFKVTLTNGTDTYSFSNDGTRSSPADKVQAFNILTPGAYRLRMTYFQNTTDAELELFAIAGNYSAWNAGMKLVGDTTGGGLAAYQITSLVSLADAESIISTPAKQAWSTVQTANSINYLNIGSETGHYTSSSAFPGVTTGTGSATSVAMQSFVMKIDSTISIPSTGYWTFAVSSDDGFHLTLLDGATTVLDSSFDGQRTPTDTFKAVNFTKAGSYTLRLVYYQSTTPGAELELYASKGSYSSWAAASTWQLVGNSNLLYTSTTALTNPSVLSLASVVNLNNLTDAERVITPPSAAMTNLASAVNAAKTVAAITFDGTTATASSTAHGFVTGDVLVISGADQPEYNGVFTITVLDANRFTFPVSGAPASPATGAFSAQKNISITRNGPTVTMSYFNHGFVTGQTVWVSGASQAEYNGYFPITVLNASTFTYTITGTPITPATGTITVRSTGLAVKSAVGGVTRTGFTATVTQVGHGYVVGQTILISGANEADYNGTFVITKVTADTFDYTLTGTPATPATGVISAQPYGICRDGSTAIVSLPAHGYSSGDSITIAGAVAAAYNGTYTISVLNANTFTYTVAGAPTSPATTAGSITATKASTPKTISSVGTVLTLVTPVTWNTTATVTLPNHGLISGQAVLISGADQTQYNGTFTITVLDANRFTYTVTGAPGTPASGAIAVQPYTFSRSGATAIVWLPNHGFGSGDYIKLAGTGPGLTVSEYNGTFPITVLSANVFTYAVVNAPVSPGAGTALTAAKVQQAWSAGNYTTTLTTINNYTTGSTGHFSGDVAFPGMYVGNVMENFAVEAKTSVFIPSAGLWTFGVNSDEGFRLTLSGDSGDFSMEYNGLRTPGDTLATFDVPAPGLYQMRLVYFQKLAGNTLELYAAAGRFTNWVDTTTWRLVGDIGGLGTSLGNVATVTAYQANIPVTSLAVAQSVANDPSKQLSVATEYRNVVDLFNTGEEGHFGNNLSFPGISSTDPVAEADDFVIQVQATVNITTAGPWIFAVGCDDGFSLNFLDGDTPVGAGMQRSGTGTFTDATEVFNFTHTGFYNLQLLYYQHVGGAGLELSAAQQPAAKTLTNAGTKITIPSKYLTGITRSGTTATVTDPNHGFASGDTVVISGASQPEYNGVFVITNATTNTFDYTVAGSPATPATGTITAGRSVTIARSGTTATVTLTNHGFLAGDMVLISGANEPVFNGAFAVVSVTTNTFTYTISSSAAAAATGTLSVAYAGITRSGSLATVTLHNHGLASGAYVYISGADQPEYNGYVRLTAVTTNTFTYTVYGTPVSPATGALAFQTLSMGTSYTVSKAVSGAKTISSLTRARPVSSITRSGTLATVTCFGHGYSTGNSIVISGANETAYNGTYTVTVVDSNTFTYTVSGSPTSPATGTINAFGATVTATCYGHGYSSGNTVSISGADQPEYNGLFSVTVIDANTFTFAVTGTPASPATGTITTTYPKTVSGPKTISGITLAGSIATVTSPRHGFANGNTILISGADQSQYNGLFTIANVTTNTFTYTVSGSPASPATGTMYAVTGKSVTKIVGSGTLATVTCTAHGFSTGDLVRIGGVSQAEYNGVFAITSVDANTFTYALTGTAGTYTGSYNASYAGLTRNGATVTVPLRAHGYVNGQTVLISGASQSEYNGYFTISGVTTNTFNYTVSGSPASPASGALSVMAASVARTATLTSVTSVGTTATATLTNHYFTAGQTIVISGAAQPEYNGTFVIFNVTANTFDYTMTGAPGTAATGTISAAAYGICRNGSTAIATLAGHGFATGNLVRISGADQPEYNGTFLITVLTANTFTYTILGTPTSPATGVVTAWLGDLTRNGATATLTLPNHGYVEGQTVFISGAAQAEYNGSFVISGVTQNTFNYTLLSGTPTTPGVGTISVQAQNGITRNGTTAIVSLASHGFAAGDTVRIAGAIPTDYNGTFTITAATPNTFTYTLASTPATPAAGTPVTAVNISFNLSNFRLLGDTINGGLSMGSGISPSDMYYVLQGENPDGTRNPNYPVLMDMDNYIDYMLVEFYVGNSDWPSHNFYTGRPPDPDSTGYKFYNWDSDATLGGVTTDRTKQFVLVAQMYYYLAASPEFRMRFADHAQRALFNNGPLTAAVSAANYKSWADSIWLTVVGESARWGDISSSPGPYPHTAADFRNTINSQLANFFPARTAAFIQQLRTDLLLPTLDAPTFSVNGLSQYGGTFLPGATFSMTAAAGATIYYCQDGSDPRLPGGALNPSAQIYSGQSTLSQTALFKARAAYVNLADGSISMWSALSDAAFYPDLGPLIRITELMYNPAAPSAAETLAGYTNSDFEYIEIRNIGSVAVPLAGMQLTNGVDFSFPDISVAPDEYKVIAANETAFRVRYGNLTALIPGSYTGHLSSSGEKIELVSPVGGVIHSFTYSDGWYSQTDGEGFSLTIRNSQQDLTLWDSSAGWRSSAAPGGTPGTADTLWNPGSIIVNEVLPHTDPPQSDTIELANTTDQSINVGGWFVSDDKSDLLKYQIAAGTTIPAHGFLVLSADANFNNPHDSGCRTAFLLSEYGEDVYVSSNVAGAAGGYREHVDFDATPNGVVQGVYFKSTGGSDFTLLQTPTLGTANATVPYIAPLVISQIMYHPADPSAAELAAGFSDADNFEYLDLYNRSGTTLSLTDFYLADGVGFSFGWRPNGTTDEVWTLEPGATASWTTSSLQTDSYTVWAHLRLLGGDGRRRSLDALAQYTIQTAAGPVVVVVDQNQPIVTADEVWVDLGTYAFNGAASVELVRGLAGAGDWTIAGQIRFTKSGHTVTLANPNLDSFATRSGQPALESGAHAVLVSNYAAFDARYHVAANSIPVVGVYNGNLDNNGEMLRLYQVGVTDPDIVPGYIIDHVNYGDSGDWPSKPDGDGSSLVRVHPAAYGNDPLNWQSSAVNPLPGQENAHHDKSAPTTPTSVVAHAAAGSPNTITLTWNASIDPQSYVDHYVVYRDGQVPVFVSGTSYTDSAVQAAVAYAYQISAVNRDGYESELSAAVTVSVPGVVSSGTPEGRVEIVFSEPLRADSATLAANYTINGVPPTSAVLAPGGTKVTLTTNAFNTTTLVAAGAAAKILTPSSGSLGSTWTQTGFSDSAWTPGTTGVGYSLTLPAESEPNDALATANSAVHNFSVSSSSLYHLTLRGTAHTSSNVDDWFRIGTLDAGDVLTITGSGSPSARGTATDLYLELWRAGSGTALTTDDGSGPGLDPLISRYSVSTADTYYVRIRRAGTVATGTYQLGVWLENVGAAPTTGGTFIDEVEANDSLGAANNASSAWRTVQMASQTMGTISTTTDVDYFKYTFTAGDLISVAVKSTSTLDVKISLLDSAGNVLALEDGTSTPSDTLSSSLFAYSVAANGTYYLKVESTGSTTGTYTANVYLSSAALPGDFRPLLATNVQASMLGVNATAYVRVAFSVADPAAYTQLRLRMKYDDGFVAYLNGVEIARRNAPTTLAWNSAAAATRADYLTTVGEEIDVTAYLSLLNAGSNVLAVQVLNASAADDDLLLVPELIGGRVGAHYTVTANNLTTQSGNTLPANIAYSFDYTPQGSGYAVREYFAGISGSNVSDLTNSGNFPANPAALKTFQSSLEDVLNYVTSAYGTRMRAYLYPPMSGYYTFWVSSSAASEVWLSLDESSSNAQKIAYIAATAATYPYYRQWATVASQQSAPVYLTAGNRYYIEVLHKATGSGDHCEVRWQLPDGSWENGDINGPIPGVRLSPFTPTPDITPPSAPEDFTATLTAGNQVRLAWSASVDAESSAISYQVYRDGVAYLSPVTTTYFVDTAVSATVRHRYQVLAINADGYSSALSLSLNIAPLGIMLATGWSPTAVQVTFTEALDPVTAQVAANYAVSGVTVSAAHLEADGVTVTLTTSAMALGSTHTVSATGVTTLGGAAIPTGTPTSFNYGGQLLREVYLGIGGASSISDLAFLPAYPNGPTALSFPTLFEAPVNGLTTSYSAERLRGYLCPDVSGTYYFWLASDDDGQLWLSSDDNPANKVLIASVSGTTLTREWGKYASQKSVGIPLVAGQRYYVEAIEKQNSSTDNLAVAWQRPDALSPTSIKPGVTVTALSRSSYTVTATATAHGLTSGQTVMISGATPTDYNGEYMITVVDANRFTYTIATTPGTASGTITVQACSLATKTSGATVARVGTVATLTLANHGLVNGQTVLITGATPTGYNGTFVISNVTANTFDYAVVGTLTTPATGTISVQPYAISRSGTTAIVSLANHGFVDGSTVTIAGANQPEYNGSFAISVLSPNTFSFTVSGSPAVLATGDIFASGYNLTRNVSTITVTAANHGFANGDVLAISGASVAAYNGIFTIANVATNTFTYTVTGTPMASATPGSMTAAKLVPIPGNYLAAAAPCNTTLPYSISIEPKGTANPSPKLTGDVSNTGAVVTVNVNGVYYAALNNGDYTWTLSSNSIQPALADGTYRVTAYAVDSFGRAGFDNTLNELTIDRSTPVPQFVGVAANRITPLTQLQIVFNEPVENVDLADLRLTCNGGPDLITGGELLATTDGVTWTLSGLPVAASVRGVYRLTLLAASNISDAGGNEITADASVTWTVDQAPSATVGLNTHAPLTNGVLLATATKSDPDGDPVGLTFLWKVNGALQRTFISATALSDTFDLGAVGNGDHGDTITVEVIPNDGIASGATVVDTATVGNTAPGVAASLASVTVTEGQAAANNGTFVDLDKDLVTLTASVGTPVKDANSGTWTWTLGNADGPSQSQTVVLTATDSQGTQSTTSFQLIVNNAPPVASIAGPGSGTAGAPLTLGGTASDPSSVDQTAGFGFAWTVIKRTNAGTTKVGSGSGASFSFTPGGAALYEVRLIATDKDGGASAAAIHVITVDSGAPTVIPADVPAPVLAVVLEAASASAQAVVTVPSADQAGLASVITALTTVAAPSNPVTMQVNLTASLDYQGLTLTVPHNVTLIIDGQNGQVVIHGHSPALVVTEGQVIVQNGVTLETDTDSPTILVSGGSLSVRNSTIKETVNGVQAAIQISGGAVDLGTTADAGGNVLVVQGAGLLIENTSSGAVSALRNTWKQDATTLVLDSQIENLITHYADNHTYGLVTWNTLPTVATSAYATPSPVAGTTTALAVRGADTDTGEGSLTYTWTTAGTPPASVLFSANGSNGAQNTTATFTQAGTYDFQVTISDPGGQSIISSVTVVVNQTLTSIAVSPALVNLYGLQTRQFTATAKDQFGMALGTQPGFSWSTTAGGITTGGFFTAPLGNATATVTATSGGVSGSGTVNVTGLPQIVSWQSARNHGASLTDVTLTIPDDATFGEPRNGGVRRLLVNFDHPIAPGSFTQGSVQLAGRSSGGSLLNLSAIGISVSLANGNMQGIIDFGVSLPDYARYLVRLQGITDAAGNALYGDSDRIFTNLKGDVSGDLRTNVTDLSTIQANRSTSIDRQVVKQVRSDVSVDGKSNVTDQSISWANRTKDARYIIDPTLGGSGLLSGFALSAFASSPVFSLAASADMGLSNGSLLENQPAGSLVGELWTMGLTAASFSLLDDGGGQFMLDGNRLLTTTSFDYETQNAYSIRVQATSLDGQGCERAFTILIDDANDAPLVAQAAAASLTPGGMTVNLAALAADDAGETNVTYTWTTTRLPVGASLPSFSSNGANGAKNVVATVNQPGEYDFTVTMVDAEGLSTTSSVTVTTFTPPQIVSWLSARTHTNVGELGLTILDDGTFSEPRSGGVKRLYVAFDAPIAAQSFLASSVQLLGVGLNAAPVNLSSIVVSTNLRNGNTVGVIDFSAGLPDKARYALRLVGVTDTAGHALAGDNDRVFTVLKGDANGDLRVNVTDLSWIQGSLTSLINSASVRQVRSDVNLDGRVNATDLSMANSSTGVDTRSIAAPVLPLTSLPSASVPTTGSAVLAPVSATSPIVVAPIAPVSTSSGSSAPKLTTAIRSNEFLRALDVVLIDWL